MITPRPIPDLCCLVVNGHPMPALNRGLQGQVLSLPHVQDPSPNLRAVLSLLPAYYEGTFINRSFRYRRVL